MHRTPGRFDRQWTLHRRPRADSGVAGGAFCRYHRSMPSARRFPPPWIIEEHNSACFIVKGATGQALAYFYFEDEPALPRPSVVWTLTN
jgi:hypothetical protein